MQPKYNFAAHSVFRSAVPRTSCKEYEVICTTRDKQKSPVCVFRQKKRVGIIKKPGFVFFQSWLYYIDIFIHLSHSTVISWKIQNTRPTNPSPCNPEYSLPYYRFFLFRPSLSFIWVKTVRVFVSPLFFCVYLFCIREFNRTSHMHCF